MTRPNSASTDQDDWMPAETHQRGGTIDAKAVLALLRALLSKDDVAEDAVLADLGIGAENLATCGMPRARNWPSEP